MSRQVADPPMVDADLIRPEELDLLASRPNAMTCSGETAPLGGVVVGTLVALEADGAVPFVVYDGQPTAAAQRARAIVDLHGAHVGREVLLAFENANRAAPIVVGCLTERTKTALHSEPGLVEVDADGQRLVVTAKTQLVLECGKARITLTRCGKVLLEGTYISSRSSGVNRVKGGSIQLN